MEEQFITKNHEQKAHHLFGCVQVCIGQGQVSVMAEDFSLKVDVPLAPYSTGNIVLTADPLIYDAQTVYTFMAMLHNHLGFELMSLSLEPLEDNVMGSLYKITIYSRAGE